ncbi:MAG: lysophospholipid acyltransferase family protein [Candidatus Eisenbacteria bacterium]|nr:lysophospholipid acyltransferase family protein [Candidatus Eisenbacteria bacterium]
MKLHYRLSWHIVNSFFKFGLGMKVDGKEYIPPGGGLIVATNHISFWDPPLLGAASTRELYYLAKEELFRNVFFRKLIQAFNAVPIGRDRFDRKGLFAVISHLKKGRALLVFPEGGRNLSGELKPARTGIGMMAMETSSPILPAYISGSDKIKKALRRKGRVRISFGPPIRTSEFPPVGRAGYRELSAEVMKRIQALKETHEKTGIIDDTSMK